MNKYTYRVGGITRTTDEWDSAYTVGLIAMEGHIRRAREDGEIAPSTAVEVWAGEQADGAPLFTATLEILDQEDTGGDAS